MTTLEQFKLAANALRQQIQVDADAVKDLKTASVLKEMPVGVDAPEAIANIMLAFRHLEDARMRLGKAIQATDGGVSVYDRRRPTIDELEKILAAGGQYKIQINPDGSIHSEPV